MKRYYLLLPYLLVFVSCSTDNDAIENLNIKPPNFINGTWISSSSDPEIDGKITYTFSTNNVIEIGVFERDNGAPFKVDYKFLFSSDKYLVEEEITDDSYTLNLSYKSGEIAFFEDTNFRIPISRKFILVSENLLAAPFPNSNVGLIKQ
tara:strand:+ start:539 stop:985 length:447 start_codon:yes stop_codon:yes gene_type:complete